MLLIEENLLESIKQKKKKKKKEKKQKLYKIKINWNSFYFTEVTEHALLNYYLLNFTSFLIKS